MKRQVLAGHYAINERWPWATVAGCSLHCTRCGAEGRAPLPRDGQATYNAAVEGFLAEHRHEGVQTPGNEVR